MLPAVFPVCHERSAGGRAPRGGFGVDIIISGYVIRLSTQDGPNITGSQQALMSRRIRIPKINEHTTTALLGQAVGDAFGAPFEYHERAADLARYSVAERRYLDAVKDCGSNPSRSRLPGLYTDDTQQALAVIRATLGAVSTHRILSVESARATANEAATLFSGDMRKMMSAGGGSFGVHRGTGKNFRDVVRTNRAVDTAGMGAAMRIAPLATLFADDYNPMPEYVTAISRMTTSNDDAVASAVMLASTAMDLIERGADLAEIWRIPKGNLSPYLMWPDTYPHAPWQRLWTAYGILDRQGEKTLLAYAQKFSDKLLDCAANGYALTGVPWAIYHALNAESFEDSLLRACGSGGDTDTVCAMTGALAALRFGRESIPSWMLEGLHGRDHLENPDQWDPVGSELPLTLRELAHQKG